MMAAREGERDILLRKVSYGGVLPKNAKYFFLITLKKRQNNMVMGLNKQYGIKCILTP